MKNYLTSALNTLEARRSESAWSRLDHQPLGYPTTDATPEQGTSEMRHYLAAQTSQVI